MFTKRYKLYQEEKKIIWKCHKLRSILKVVIFRSLMM